jgi:hypothetical protein
MKNLGIALLILLSLAGLVATACGGFFTVAVLPEVLSKTSASGGYGTGILMIAAPSLIVGLVVVVLCIRGLARLLAPAPPPERTAAPSASRREEP